MICNFIKKILLSKELACWSEMTKSYFKYELFKENTTKKELTCWSEMTNSYLKYECRIDFNFLAFVYKYSYLCLLGINNIEGDGDFCPTYFHTFIITGPLCDDLVWHWTCMEKCYVFKGALRQGWSKGAPSRQCCSDLPK